MYGVGAEQADIISIIELNSNGQLTRSDIVFAKLDEINESNKDFVKNVYLVKEEVDDANKNNYGFLGGFVEEEAQPGQYRIERNKAGYSDLVTALKEARETKGTIYLDNSQRNMTFENIKKGMLIGSQNCAKKTYRYLDEKGRSRDE